MHRLRLWLDRQLIEESWPYRGFSPLNWFILAVILFSAVLFAAETEPLAVARYPLVLQAANLAILTVFALEFALRLFSAGETRGLKGLWMSFTRRSNLIARSPASVSGMSAPA